MDKPLSQQELNALRRRRIIRVDGTEEFIDRPVSSFSELEKRIGATSSDTVTLKHLGRPPVVMVVDDKGYETDPIVRGNTMELRPTRALKPVNEKATALYHANCRPGTTHQIVGDVFIGPDSDWAGYY
jgi:hypothetical protein